MGSESHEIAVGSKYIIDFRPIVKAAKPILCTLVHTFPADIDPPRNKVLEYLSGPAGEPPPSGFFKATEHPVDIFQKEDGPYIRMPRTAHNQRFIRSVE